MFIEVVIVIGGFTAMAISGFVLDHLMDTGKIKDDRAKPGGKTRARTQGVQGVQGVQAQSFKVLPGGYGNDGKVAKKSAGGTLFFDQDRD